MSSQNAIAGLKPDTLWQRFFEITQIPRASKKEGKVVVYLKELAEKLKLDFKEDKVGNIVISLPATTGYEKSKIVVLQGHVDMVCEKNKGTAFDFDNDPIKLLREDGWITAEGTTLGADNGIGVAAALSVLTDKNLVHGPIECLFTVDEETGLTGANNLEPGFITGKILLNLDSEEQNAFYIGCAGGIDTQGSFNIKNIKTPSGYKTFNLVVKGLKGGHSGAEINLGRANAIKVLSRVLKELENIDYYIAYIEGGSKRNAIPREAEAVILVKNSDTDSANKIVNKLHSEILAEFKIVDGNLSVNLDDKGTEIPAKVYTKDFSSQLIKTLLAIPHGVIMMSPDIPGLVETSTNLATVNTTANTIVVGTSQRSSIESAKKYIAESVKAIFEISGSEVIQGDGYPGWKPNMDSEILRISRKAYEELFKSEPEVMAIHAGLECGILGDKYPGLDMISFGPTITGAHSPDEKVNIHTVEQFYQLLSKILSDIARQIV